MARVSPTHLLRILLLTAAFVFIGGGRMAWSQMPIQNVTIPVPPIHGGPPAIIQLNPQGPRADQQQPVQQPFTFFGLKQPTASGLCTQVTTTYIALLNGSQQFQVFTLPAGFIPPQALMPGRQITVVYQVLSNGLNQVKKIVVQSTPQNTYSGPPIPNTPVPGLVGPNTGAPNVSPPRIVAPSIGAPNMGAPH